MNISLTKTDIIYFKIEKLFQDGNSYTKIASLMKTTRNSISGKIFRGREKFNERTKQFKSKKGERVEENSGAKPSLSKLRFMSGDAR